MQSVPLSDSVVTTGHTTTTPATSIGPGTTPNNGFEVPGTVCLLFYCSKNIFI